MSVLRALLAARAAADGRAQRVTPLRHRYLSARPMALVGYQMAGEEHSLLAACLGTDRSRPHVVVVGEPRNRDLLYAGFREVGGNVLPYIDRLGDARETITRERRSGGAWTEVRCREAPQLVVANGRTLDLVSRWGRLLRYHEDPAIAQLGMHLTFFGLRSLIPGQCSAVVLTDLLRQHWVTGQSQLEDENLATLDAWIEPRAGVDGRDAASEAERTVTIGPLTDPDGDRRLADLVAAFNAARRVPGAQQQVAGALADIRSVVEPQLLAAWEVHWRCLERERAFTEAGSVEGRWGDDRREFTRHIDYVRGGGRFRSRDTARDAARRRLAMERALAELEARQAFDDPVLMAEQELAGRAVTGVVVRTDLNHREISERGNALTRPLLTIAVDDERVLPLGKELRWSADPARVVAEVRAVDPMGGRTEITLMVTHGMRGKLPQRGATVCFCELSSGWRPNLELPRDAPWTHTGAGAGEQRIDSEWPAEQGVA